MEAYAHLTGRNKSYVAMEALRDYLDERIPQIEDLKEAVLAADQGEFSSEDEVGAVVAKYSDLGASRTTLKSAAPLEMKLRWTRRALAGLKRMDGT